MIYLLNFRLSYFSNFINNLLLYFKIFLYFKFFNIISRFNIRFF